MKPFVGFIRFLLLILFIPPFIFAQPYKIRDDVTTCVTVRNDHVTTSKDIACLGAGTTVEVLSSIPFWREIKFNTNKTGWIAKKYLVPLSSSNEADGDRTIPENANLAIHFVDVGQGDGIWIQTHDDGIDGNGKFEGYSIVIDGGPYSADDSNPLLPYMETQGHHGAIVESLIVTHPHDDHFSGAETISRHFAVNHYYDPGYPELKSTASFLTFQNEMKGGRAKNVHIGKQNFGKLDWGKEVDAEILYAWEGDDDNTLGSGNTEVNNASIVLRLQYGDHVFIFMGDAEGKDRADAPDAPSYVEKILLAGDTSKLKANLLKVAHHGSETSSTLPFIQAVNPDVLIVQSGRKKFKGTFLPDASTLKRYCTFNNAIQIYRTDEGDQGLDAKAAVDKDNIVVQSNGKGKLKVQARRNGQPFAGNTCPSHH